MAVVFEFVRFPGVFVSNGGQHLSEYIQLMALQGKWKVIFSNSVSLLKK